MVIITSQEKSLIRKKLYLKYLISSRNKNLIKSDGSKKKIIVALAADYGNLGDVAITYAQTKFLKSQFPDHEIIDFPISKMFQEMKQLKSICTDQDIITIVGGGNTGDMYDDIEYCRQFIIQKFPNNKIISFPQTIDFSNTDSGKKALKRAIKVYSKHRDLTLSAREESSYQKYKEHFTKNKVLFLPDIVLSLDEEFPKYERKGITLCLRSDGEKKIDKIQEEILISRLKENYDITHYDTHISKNNLSIKERESELDKIWRAFKKSKLVVTDRLHGMIFCAITKTPCIALDNSNKKISGVYNAWLKDYGYIKMVDKVDSEALKDEINSLMNNVIKDLPDLKFNKDFDPLIDAFTQK